MQPSLKAKPDHHGPPNLEVARYWNKLLAPYQHSSYFKGMFQLLTTGLLFGLGWLSMYWSLSVSYLLTLLLAIPTSGLLIRLFIFQHDCGHGSFLPSRRANNIVGSILGVLMLTPYYYWQRTHAIHHGTSGDLDRRSFGDIETLTVKEYLALSRIDRLKYRIYRNLFVLLAIGPAYQFVIKHRLPIDIPFSWKREWKSVMWTNVAIAVIVLVAWQTIGLRAFLMVQLPVTLLSGAIGMWLFYVQHQFEDTYWENHDEWDFHQAGIEGSSYYDLPSVLHWFTGNIGFHHIHHLASRIPNYNLKRCFSELPQLHHVTRLTILESLRCANLQLWSEDLGKLISIRQLGFSVASNPRGTGSA